MNFNYVCELKTANGMAGLSAICWKTVCVSA